MSPLSTDSFPPRRRRDEAIAEVEAKSDAGLSGGLYPDERAATASVTDVDLPDGWSIDVEPQGWMARARSADDESGVAAYGQTREEAVEALRLRMRDWRENSRRNGTTFG